jgi:hypothetical protein
VFAILLFLCFYFVIFDFFFLGCDKFFETERVRELKKIKNYFLLFSHELIFLNVISFMSVFGVILNLEFCVKLGFVEWKR